MLKSADVDLERTRSSARYLLAKCCVELGYYGEAEEVLVRHAREKFSRVVDKNAGIVNGVKINGNWSEAMDAWIIQEARPCPIPNGAAGLNLLGLICRKTNRNQRSIEYHRMALKLDPLMWTSYEAICELSGPVGSSTEADDPNSIFGVPAPVLSPRNEENALGAQHNFFRAGKSRTTRASLGGGAPSAFMKNRYGTPSTPYSSFGNMDLTSGLTTTAPNESGVNFHLPATASTKADRTKAGTSTFPANNLFDAPSNATKTPAPTNLEKPPTSAAVGYADQVLDRARRVVAGLAYDPSPEQKSRPGDNGKDLTFSRTPASASGLTSGATTAPFSVGVSTVKGEKRSLFASNMKSSPKKSPKKEESKVDEDEHQPLNLSTTVRTIEDKQVEKIMQLLCGVGAAYKSLCQFKSDDALELFRELPREQQQTGWVQHQIGKAYFEMSDYQNAERALKLMQKVEPHRMKGLDILSTTLWQLKKEVELSDLAQQAVGFDRMAPEAWFVVGNCFSLQKEHDTAITFFRRSIQLNPSFTYAHTLCGHEFTSNEDYEKAILSYRDAIRVDSKHYNAWYGLGAIFFRQEKFELAEYHFQRALELNPMSSVLHCHLGMAQHQNGKTEEALETLSGAFRLDPRNPQAHYQRATIFMALDQPQAALEELEMVRSAAPKEASVHFNMGKVYKRLGHPEKAMRCFLTALDLDPKDNNLIKAAMDRLDEPDVEEEVSVF